MAEHAPFDPSDPFDAMAENFRRQVVDMAISADKISIYRELDTARQLECFVSGAMTAIVGVCFASIQNDSRDEMIGYLSKCWPQARKLAESIIENGRAALHSGGRDGE